MKRPTALVCGSSKAAICTVQALLEQGYRVTVYDPHPNRSAVRAFLRMDVEYFLGKRARKCPLDGWDVIVRASPRVSGEVVLARFGRYMLPGSLLAGARSQQQRAFALKAHETWEAECKESELRPRIQVVEWLEEAETNGTRR